MFFSDVHEAHRAYEARTIDLQAKVQVRIKEYVRGAGDALEPRRRLVKTTVGRALLSEILPHGMSFDLVNQDMTKKNISAIINACYRVLGLKETVVFADQLMYTGFDYATRAAVSFGIDDIVIPEQKSRAGRCRRARSQGNSGPVCLGPGDQRRALQQGGRHLVARQ